jgi:hypothetical protein
MAQLKLLSVGQGGFGGFARCFDPSRSSLPVLPWVAAA